MIEEVNTHVYIPFRTTACSHLAREENARRSPKSPAEDEPARGDGKTATRNNTAFIGQEWFKHLCMHFCNYLKSQNW